jgi:hypothetical protein
MRLHHRQGLAESKSCEQRAFHLELKEFCTRLTSEQQPDMRQVGKVICEWYRDCLEVEEAALHQERLGDCAFGLSRYRAVSQRPAITRPIAMSDTARPFLRTSRSVSAATPVW